MSLVGPPLCGDCGIANALRADLAAQDDALGAFTRVAQLASWIADDRRESDKVLAYALELGQLADRMRGRSAPSPSSDVAKET